MGKPKTAARIYLEELCSKFPDAKEDVILQAESELVGLLDDLGMLADEWGPDEI